MLRNAAQCNEVKHSNCLERKKDLPLLAVLLLESTELLLDVHALHLRETSSVLGWVWLAVVRQRGLLPPGLFLC
jgi:hypothetical protein